MNRKILAVAVGIMILGVMAGIMLCLLRNLSVSYECKVDFLYEYERPAGDVTSRGAIENYSDKRRLRHDDILYGFKRELDLFSSKKGAIMCQRDIESLREPISRIEAVLASARLEVVGMPSTNFVYPCRLILVDGDSRNLCEYARFCMDRVKERLADENWILVAKVALHEYEQMHKAELRIKELEKRAVDGGWTASDEVEMKQARQIVREMQMRIEEIRKDVMSRREQRIIHESPPKISSIIRRESCK